MKSRGRFTNSSASAVARKSASCFGAAPRATASVFRPTLTQGGFLERNTTRRLLPRLLLLLAVAFGLAACERPSPAAIVPASGAPLAGSGLPPTPTAVPPTPTLANTRLPAAAAPTATAVFTATATAVPTAVLSPTPVYTGPLSPACGQLLPIAAADTAVVTSLTPNAEALARLRERIPAAALPALLHLLEQPGSVGLAAYQVGLEGDGAYLNADAPMPLASVVKVLTLVAYAEAVAAGTVNPLETVPLADLEAFYQPGLDLSAHPRAVDALTAEGRTFGEPPAALLETVPRMMTEFSSNAAADYLHLRLGQTAIEETALALGLESQTAPCPFLGQFLAMGNVTRDAGDDQAAVQAFIADPAAYGAYAMEMVDAYRGSQAFRDAQTAWRQETRRPASQVQRLFTAALNPRGSARDYAGLMARLALNGLSNGDSSYIARRYLEWPMQYAANQALFSNLGYKNGSMPGVLTTVYYAYPLNGDRPVVVALFFRDLPGQTYRTWRQSLAHDELARWLLSDPEAIGILRQVVNP
ncbi:MAG: serine hydrolase [Anaerolineales bacterium]|nr:serine hydrolase [Anaerolineales bacterium]